MLRLVYSVKDDFEMSNSRSVSSWLTSHPEIVAVHDTREKEVLFEKAEDRKRFFNWLTGRD